MAVDLEALKNHPHANPKYLHAVYLREVRGFKVRLPNKYLPHAGKKEMARHANS